MLFLKKDEVVKKMKLVQFCTVLALMMSLWLVFPHPSDATCHTGSSSVIGRRSPTHRLPSVSPYPHSSKCPPPPPPPPTGFSVELKNYSPGQIIHPHYLPWTHTTSHSIYSRGLKNKIVGIVVTGFADGIPNDGIRKIPLTSLLPNCRKIATSPIDDEKLAKLRACMIFSRLQILLTTLRTPHYGGIAWNDKYQDEPDGGNQGGSYRKVRVDVHF